MCNRGTKTILLCALALLALLCFNQAARAVPVSATLTSVVGDVQVKAKDGSWTKASEGMTVKEGAQIKTGGKSTVVIKWSSQNTIKLTPFSNFTIKKMDVDPRSKTVSTDADLSTGKIKGRAEKMRNPNSNYKISTPTAVAGVRGTTFDMSNTADNTTNLSTYDGLVDITAQGQTVSVPAGMTIQVMPGEAPPQPTPLTTENSNTCTDNEDCWSGVCVDGKCANETASVGGTCYPEAAECAENKQCCSGACDNGACTAVDPATLAAACVADKGACDINDECCSKSCVNGECAAAAAASTAGTCSQDGIACTTSEECCSNTCENGFCTASDEANIFVNITNPGAGKAFPITSQGITLNGTTLPGANCMVNGTPFTAGADGSFNGTIGDLSPGDLNIDITCNDADGNTANDKVSIFIKDLPMLIVTSPPEGFITCPTVNISGYTDPDASVSLNSINIFSNKGAVVTSDGSFTLNGFHMNDCGMPLVFEARDEFGQLNQVIVNPGTGGNVEAMGVNISEVRLTLTPSGQWLYGQTEVFARVSVKSSAPIPPGIIIDFFDAGDGDYLQSALVFLQSALAFPQYGASTSASGEYYAEAEAVLYAGPGILSVVARLGGKQSSVNTVDLKAPVCFAGGAAMQAGDGVDNDCDGLIDEELRDSVDNDGDGRIDEDVMCDFGDGTADCDRDGTANASDCNPFDPFIQTGCTGTFAFNGIWPDDRIDNDRDGLVDEEVLDGFDNDGDGRIDEDPTAMCDFGDPFADCDYDGVKNTEDCNAFDPAVTIQVSDPACGAACDPFGQPDADCDRDGLINAEELMYGTSPFSNDTDGDGFPDTVELNEGTDPANPASNPGMNLLDTDKDGYPDQVEYAYGSDPTNAASTPASIGAISAADSDGDGYPDEIEYAYGSDPYNAASIPGQTTSYAAGTYCPGGQIMDPATGQCYCPMGTTWDPNYYACTVPTYMQCAAGEYFDQFVGACVTACSGGQTADPYSGNCYCANGFMDFTTGSCVSGCPILSDGTQMEQDPYGGCVCPADKPYFGTVRNLCVTQCLDTQIADPYSMQCVCPYGTYLDYVTSRCVETTSTTMCPPGTMGAYCDFGVFGDCDGDGYNNYDEADKDATTGAIIGPGMACFNESGMAGMVCPPDSPAAGCDLGDPNADCEYDGAANGWDPCPCAYGTPNENYCPAFQGCPAGLLMEPRIMQCVSACPPDMMPNSTNTECVCAGGLFYDYMSNQCTSSCPAPSVPRIASDGSTFCGCAEATPLFDDFMQTCTTACSGGAQPSLDYSYCECPPGMYPDYAMAMCMTMNTDYCATAPGAPGCPCTDGSTCDSTVCDINGYCAPGGGCVVNGTCEPWNAEDSYSCGADCWCGDGMCDGAEASSMSCPNDCQGGCDASVAAGDCDGDGFMNASDMCPYEFAQMSADGCPSCSYTNGDCTTSADCCNYGDICLLRTDLGGIMACTYQNSGTLCNNNTVCEPGMGENQANCPGDCGTTACNSYITQPTCTTDPNCIWDAGLNQCNFDTSGGCGAYADMTSCNGDMACAWNTYTMLCNPAGGAFCPSYMSQLPCQGDPGCMWDAGIMTCMANGGGAVCGDAMCYFPSEDNATCPSDCLCNFDSVCDPGEAPDWCGDCSMIGTCSSNMDSMSCMGDPTCYWNSASGACYDNTFPCSNYTMDTTCAAAPGCSWNAGMMQCETAGATCASIMDQMSCEGNNCVWNVTVCQDYAGGCNMNSICESGESMMTCTVDCPACSAMMDPVDCFGDAACTWNGVSCEPNSACNFDNICQMGENTANCLNDCPSCMDIIDQMACSADPACAWNVTSCIMGGGGPEINCTDTIDNDSDSFTDCADSDCVSDPACMGGEVNCTDTIDNDSDTMTDCADPDCSADPACVGGEVNCTDTIDNDSDTMTDCADPDCSADPACVGGEVNCTDTIDNDSDTMTDCADPDCSADPACIPETNCTDAIDNDSDTFTDCADTDCSADPACIPETNCTDTIDNDSDAMTDCADTDCSADPACIEAGNCTDTIDNDSDTMTDCVDPDCSADPACVESICNDTVDNDSDTMTDCADTDCSADAWCNCTDATSCGGYGFQCVATDCSTCAGPPFANGCGGASPTDCTSNFLSGGVECAACSTAADCFLTAVGLACNAGVCDPTGCGTSPNLAAGCSCTSGTDCTSVNCLGNICQ